MSADARRPVYVFAGQQCPRCRGWDTVATSTQGDVQYRRCRAVVCQHRYAVVGRLVEDRDKQDKCNHKSERTPR